jgi:DNA-binding PadR family transcriptional regulator
MQSSSCREPIYIRESEFPMSKEPNYTTYVGKDMSLLIILSLLYHDGSHSGYSLLKRVKEITEGKFEFRVGKIYDQVDELLNQGFLTQEIQQITEKKVKAVYSLSTKGIDKRNRMLNEWKDIIYLFEKLIFDKNEI